MLQKKTWMLYLLFGSSIILLLSLSSCETDYEVKSKWIYINDTEYSIEYSPSEIWGEFKIAANDSTIYMESALGPESVAPEDYLPPINAEKVIFSKDQCNYELALKLRDISSYTPKKIGDRYYEFTFRFTEEAAKESSACE